MKKYLSILMLVGILASVFVGAAFAQDDMMSEITCPDSGGEVTIAGGSVGAELDFLTEAANTFMEACPDVVVNVVEMPDSATDRLNIYLQTWEAQSPDIDVFQVDVIWPAIIEPHVVDMNEYLTEEELGWYFEDMINGQTVGEKLVAIPWFADAAGLYYRTDLFEQYGVDVPATWDDVAAAAQTIQDGVRADTGNEDFYGFVWQGNDYEGLTCDAHEWIVAETGETFISPDGEVNVNNDAVINAIDRAAGWVGTISPEGVTTYQEEEARTVWQAGNAAMMRNWPYAFLLGEGEDSAVAGNFDWVPLPMGAVRSGACLGGWQVAVSQYSDNTDAAVAVAKFIAGPSEQKRRALGQGQLPSIPSVYEDPEVAESPLFVAAGPILGTAYARPSVATGSSYNEASAIFSSAVHSVLTGTTDAASAMEELEIELEDFLADMDMGE